MKLNNDLIIVLVSVVVMLVSSYAISFVVCSIRNIPILSIHFVLLAFIASLILLLPVAYIAAIVSDKLDSK